MHPNEELIRRGYAAFLSGDLDTVRSLFAEDIEWIAPGRTPLSGTFQGHDSVFAMFGDLIQRTEGSFHIELRDVCASDERVYCLTRNRMTVGDKSIDGDEVAVYDIRDGKVTRCQLFDFDVHAFEALFADEAADLNITQTEQSKIQA